MHVLSGIAAGRPVPLLRDGGALGLMRGHRTHTIGFLDTAALR